MATNEWRWLVYKGHGCTVYTLTNPGIDRAVIHPADEIAGMAPGRAVDTLRTMAAYERVSYSESRQTIYAYPALTEEEHAEIRQADAEYDYREHMKQ